MLNDLLSTKENIGHVLSYGEQTMVIIKGATYCNLFYNLFQKSKV